MPSVENTVVQSCIPRKKAKWRRSILHRADNIARRYFKSSVIRAAILSRSRFSPCNPSSSPSFSFSFPFLVSHPFRLYIALSFGVARISKLQPACESFHRVILLLRASSLESKMFPDCQIVEPEGMNLKNCLLTAGSSLLDQFLRQEVSRILPF